MSNAIFALCMIIVALTTAAINRKNAEKEKNSVYDAKMAIARENELKGVYRI